MCESYLKIFTFLSPEEITSIIEEHNKEPHLRNAQKILAREIITDLHGKEEYEKALNISKNLFEGEIRKLDADVIENVFKNVPNYEINTDVNVVDLLVDSKVCSSKREAREFLSNGSITINGDKIIDLNFLINKEYAIDEKYIVIRRGKKKYFLVKYV